MTGAPQPRVPDSFVTPEPQPKAASVVVEITLTDGSRVRFSYLAEHPDAEHDPTAGIELGIITETRHIPDPEETLFRDPPVTIRRIDYLHRLSIANAAHWTQEILPPVVEDGVDGG